jgi:hypothetical protein
MWQLRLTADCQSVLVGSSSLALYNVAEQKRVAKFMGHSVSTGLRLALLLIWYDGSAASC